MVSRIFIASYGVYEEHDILLLVSEHHGKTRVKNDR